MKNILIVGAGRSSTSLIKYLLYHSKCNNWKIWLGDQDEKLAFDKIANHPNGLSFKFDVHSESDRKKWIPNCDILISMVPSQVQMPIICDAIACGKNIVNACYVNDMVMEMDELLREKSLVFINELGLDPGIDHMSAMKIIDELRQKNAKILSFESSCGGLVAPDFDDNPWNYKITWNPLNVVNAGKSGAEFLLKGERFFFDYSQLFRNPSIISFPDFGDFEVYPNRNSLKYKQIYSIYNVQTLVRGTIRKIGFCSAWQALVKLGMTDDEKEFELHKHAKISDFTSYITHMNNSYELKKNICEILQITEEDPICEKLEFLGLFSNEHLENSRGTAAQILLEILNKKLLLKDSETDMVIMHHRFVYEMNNSLYETISCMKLLGVDSQETAMSLSVGLPVAICAKLILQDRIKSKGVVYPTTSEIYGPVLKELFNYGIAFQETTKVID